MEAAPIVTLIGTAIAVAVIATYLIIIAAILIRVSGRLKIILGAVAQVHDLTGPAGAVIDDINQDLAAGQQALEDCVQRLNDRIAQEQQTEQPYR